jgi:glycosyltransferase involved in cell wall biosynthesis
VKSSLHYSAFTDLDSFGINCREGADSAIEMPDCLCQAGSYIINRPNMKVLVLTKYDQLAASTRYRFSQFAPYLLANGVELELSPLLSDTYLEERFSRGKASPIHSLNAFIRRAKVVLSARKYDRVILYFEAFPYFPAFFEMILRFLKVPYIYDFDDAIFHQYDRHSNPFIRFLLRNKIRNVIRGASCVFAGNEYLAAYARQVNSNVSIFPTVVDTRRYLVVEKKSNSRSLVVGWIGSPSTAIYLKEQIPVLRDFCSKYGAKLVLIGSGPIEMPGIPVEIKDWSEDTEIAELQQFDVGIMPLPDTDWARGKCGFKLIQYMACGVPVIASPVGVNQAIVENGVNGYLASTPAEWFSALESLQSNEELRKTMGRAGRERIEARYSLQTVAPRMLKQIQGCE